MAHFLEFEDKQVENAVERASQELNIPKDKLKYDVISYGSSGIFGLVGAKKARIRVTLPGNKKPNKKRSGKPEPKPTDDEPRQAPAAAPPTAEADKTEQEEIADTISSLMEETFETADTGEPPASADPEPPAEATPPTPSAPPEATSDSALPSPADTGPSPDNPAEPAPPEAPFPPGSDSEAALEKGAEALQQIIGSITQDAEVVVQKDPERVLFDVKGGNAGVLIGRRGQTLEAIQYLIEKIVNKNAAHRIRVQVDIEGYIDGRRNRLEELAGKLSNKAKRTGKPVTLGQLNSHDRRIVHLSLRDDDAVRTQSLGDGFYRKLVIFPKKKGRKKKNA